MLKPTGSVAHFLTFNPEYVHGFAEDRRVAVNRAIELHGCKASDYVTTPCTGAIFTHLRLNRQDLLPAQTQIIGGVLCTAQEADAEARNV